MKNALYALLVASAAGLFAFAASAADVYSKTLHITALADAGGSQYTETVTMSPRTEGYLRCTVPGCYSLGTSGTLTPDCTTDRMLDPVYSDSTAVATSNTLDDAGVLITTTTTSTVDHYEASITTGLYNRIAVKISGAAGSSAADAGICLYYKHVKNPTY